MNAYQKIIVAVLISIAIVVFGIFFLTRKKSNNSKDAKDAKDAKDENLKISINLVTRENYEETPNPNNNNEEYNRCNQIVSLLGDSNDKGFNDMYKNITGKESLLKLPIDCSQVSLNDIVFKLLDMINEMSLKSIENKDKEKGYNDLVSSFLIVFKKLMSNNSYVNVVYDANRKVQTIELTDNQNPIIQSRWIENIISGAENEPRGRTPEITEQLKQTKEKVKNIVKLEDLENIKNNNNSKMTVNDLGVILSHFIAKYGSFLR